MVNIQDLVSIITPAYNCEEFISETIDSVLEQTYSNWEMIIVNDKSTDNTECIIKSYLEKEQRIKLINLEINSGVAKARNTALKAANGRYIAFLDSDDCWKKDKLKKQLDFMKKHHYALSYTSFEYINDNGEKTLKKVGIPLHQSYKKGLKNTAIGCLTVIVDRNIVGHFEMPHLRHGEDHFTWLEIMKRGYFAYGLDESLALYRISNNSLSSNKVKALKYQWSNYRDYEKIPIIPCIYYFLCYVFNASKKHFT